MHFFLFAISKYSTMCIACVLVAAVPSSSSPSFSVHKFRDSKISRIQPLPSTFVHAENDANASAATAAAKADATIKYYHADKFMDKNHAHKIAMDSKKKSLTNHEILK